MNKKTGICIAIVLLLACISLGAAVLLHFSSGDAPIAEIYHNGQLIQTIDLDAVSDGYEFTIESDHGTYNTVRVEPGKIAIIDASCPDHICVRTGYISDSLMPITCLPNQVIIKIKSTPNENGLDALSQ